jgi:hypothetical protein
MLHSTCVKLSALAVAAMLVGCSSDEFTGTPDAAGADSSPADAVASDVTAPPDARPDSPVTGTDGGQAEASCGVTVIQVLAEADSQILQSQASLNWGGAGAMGVRNDLGGPMEGLVRFDVSTVPSNAVIQSAQLELAWSSNATDCGASCGSCAAIDVLGTIDLYYARSDWTESTVNWSTRDGSNPWGTAGATLSGTDRSTTTVATFTRSTGQGASFTLDANALKNISGWRQNNKLSFLLQAEGNALFLAATREGKSSCPATGAAPKLVISYCP